MTTPTTSVDQQLVLTIADACDCLLGRIDSTLGHIKGITFAEYRLLRGIADSSNARASRVELAEIVRLSSAGVTRALQPLEKLGFVETHRAERDARRAIASLTPEGEELLRDACGVVDETASSLLEAAPAVNESRETLVALLRELTT
jgi:DNA-binding MarR family transcriptional regulator